MKKKILFVSSLCFVCLLAWCNTKKTQVTTTGAVSKVNNINLSTWFSFDNFSLNLTGKVLFSWEKKLWKWVKLLEKYSDNNWIMEVYFVWSYNKVNKFMKNNVESLHKKTWFLLLNNSYYNWTGFTMSNLMYQLKWKSYLSTFITDKKLQVYLIKYSTKNPSKLFETYKKITRWLIYKK